MAVSVPAALVAEDEPDVGDGDVMTSAGDSDGIDLARRVVARDHGEAEARTTARHTESPWTRDNTRRACDEYPDGTPCPARANRTPPGPAVSDE